MKMNFEWTTPKGAKIAATFAVNHITSETVNADGHKIEVKANRWEREVVSLTVNGKATEMHHLTYYSGTSAIQIGKVGKSPVLVAIPADVVDALYNDQRKADMAELAQAEKTEREYDAHYNAVLKMMDA